MSWYSFNSTPGIMEVAKSYWVLMLTASVIIMFSFMMSKFETIKEFDISQPILWEKKNFFSDVPYFNFILTIAIILISMFVFFSIGDMTSFQLTDVPNYSLVSQDVQKIFLVFASTVCEDAFSWVAIPFILFTTFYIILKKLKVKQATLIAIILVALLNPFIWVMFHDAKYGFDSVAMQSVFIFGVINTVYILVKKDVLLPLTLHPANNVGKVLWSQYKIGNVMGMFWLSVIIVVIITSLYVMRKQAKGELKGIV